MAEQAVIGNPFVFQTRFLDGAGSPFVPAVGPTIDIFSFSLTGVRNSLVTGVAMDPAIPAEVGRYTYVYTVPTAFTDGDMLYGEVYAEDGVGTVYRTLKEVALIATTTNNAGLRARFIP